MFSVAASCAEAGHPGTEQQRRLHGLLRLASWAEAGAREGAGEQVLQLIAEFSRGHRAAQKPHGPGMLSWPSDMASTGGRPPSDSTSGGPSPLLGYDAATWMARTGAPGRPATSASTGVNSAVTSGSQRP